MAGGKVPVREPLDFFREMTGMTNQRWTLVLAASAGLALVAPNAIAATTRGTFDRPPYYDGKLKSAPRHAAHVPVRFRSEPDAIDASPERSPALRALLDSLNAALPVLALTTALPTQVDGQGQPDVRFGVRHGGVTADGTPRAPGEIDTSSPPRMSFEVKGPSRAWKEQARIAAAAAGADAVITLQLGFDDYWIRQKNLKGEKAIELGTGRRMNLAWLTSLDDPVQVLQLTGALATPDGRVLRVGAEGLIARRSGMTAAMIGAQEMLSEDEIRQLTEASSGDPVWRTALRSLIEGLLGGERPR
jgi:hypothetical protein